MPTSTHAPQLKTTQGTPTQGTPGGAPHPLAVLVVEDSEADYDLLVMLLAGANYDLRTERVDDETGMREALARGGWDLVISDHRLPRFSAHAALATLQSSGTDVPFLIVSGAIGEDVAVDAMLAGADDYVMKSRLARLVPAIERSLRNAEARRRRREAEDKLRDSEARLRALAANLPGMLFQLQYEGVGRLPHFVFVSEGARGLLERAPQDLLADFDAFWALLHEADREPLREAFETAARDGARLGWEGRLATAESATMHWVRLAASPLREVDGAQVWDGLLTDVTALKHAEDGLRVSHEQLRALSAHLERAKEAERTRIAREIHDDIGGTLTGLRADIAWLRRRSDGDAVMQEKLLAMGALLDTAMDASTRIARDLHPPILDFGLVAAIQWQAADFQKRTGVECRLLCEDPHIALAENRATAVFRIFQELLTNVTKHAQARCVDVKLLAGGGDLILEVTDDGRGLAVTDRVKRGSYGIRGMQARAVELGGELELVSHSPAGTRATLVLPLAEAEAPR
jgi:signal transduction histidine kinase/FixJ family two-component response regulator